MQKIVIGFSTHKKFNLLSSIIRWVGKTPYSHVYVLFRNNDLNRGIICHAAKSFLHFIELGNFANDNKTIYSFSINVNSELYRTISQKSVDNAGKKYGILTLVGISYVTLMKWFGVKVKNPLSDKNNSYICSEWAATILQMLGLKDDPTDPERAGLKWLYQMLLEESQCKGSGVDKIK